MNEFEIDKRAVRRAFSRAALQYDAAAVMQREVCRRMLERLETLNKSQLACWMWAVVPAGARASWANVTPLHR